MAQTQQKKSKSHLSTGGCLNYNVSTPSDYIEICACLKYICHVYADASRYLDGGGGHVHAIVASRAADVTAFPLLVK